MAPVGTGPGTGRASQQTGGQRCSNWGPLRAREGSEHHQVLSKRTHTHTHTHGVLNLSCREEKDTVDKELRVLEANADLYKALEPAIAAQARTVIPRELARYSNRSGGCHSVRPRTNSPTARVCNQQSWAHPRGYPQISLKRPLCLQQALLRPLPELERLAQAAGVDVAVVRDIAALPASQAETALAQKVAANEAKRAELNERARDPKLTRF
jgi:hypothetical protein